MASLQSGGQLFDFSGVEPETVAIGTDVELESQDGIEQTHLGVAPWATPLALGSRPVPSENRGVAPQQSLDFSLIEPNTEVLSAVVELDGVDLDG